MKADEASVQLVQRCLVIPRPLFDRRRETRQGRQIGALQVKTMVLRDHPPHDIPRSSRHFFASASSFALAVSSAYPTNRGVPFQLFGKS